MVPVLISCLELRRTSVSLQLADRSVTYPKGLVEDVLIKVDQFIFPADFLVLDMKEDQNIPILLGHPFLATVEALIDVKEGTLKLRVQGESIEFKMFEALKLPVDDTTFQSHKAEERENKEDAWSGSSFE